MNRGEGVGTLVGKLMTRDWKDRTTLKSNHFHLYSPEPTLYRYIRGQ